MKINYGDRFEWNGVRVLKCTYKLIVDDASSKFRHIDLVKFREFIASLRFDYEKSIGLS